MLERLNTCGQSPFIVAWADREPSASREARYAHEAQMRSREYTGYRKVSACASCDATAICDGFYGDYSSHFPNLLYPLTLAFGLLFVGLFFERRIRGRRMGE